MGEDERRAPRTNTFRSQFFLSVIPLRLVSFLGKNKQRKRKEKEEEGKKL